MNSIKLYLLVLYRHHKVFCEGDSWVTLPQSARTLSYLWLRKRSSISFSCYKAWDTSYKIKPKCRHLPLNEEIVSKRAEQQIDSGQSFKLLMSAQSAPAIQRSYFRLNCIWTWILYISWKQTDHLLFQAASLWAEIQINWIVFSVKTPSIFNTVSL